MRSAHDYTKRHEQAKKEREEFLAKNPDKYKKIPFGQSADTEKLIDRLKNKSQRKFNQRAAPMAGGKDERK